MIPELEKALNTCNIDELAAILAHDPSLINALNDKGVPYAFVGAMQGNLALTRYIVEYTMASMNTRDADYKGILHYAVKFAYEKDVADALWTDRPAIDRKSVV